MMIQAAIFAFRCEPNRFLRGWLDRHASAALAWRYASEDFGIERARNQELNRFLSEDVPAGATHLLMLDADIVPLAETLTDGNGTSGILASDADIAYCGYMGRDCANAHIGDDDLGCGCLRISAAAATAIRKPAFAFPESEPSTTRSGCECAWFRRRCIDAGLSPRMVGLVGHMQSAIFVPSPSSTVGWKMVFPYQLT